MFSSCDGEGVWSAASPQCSPINCGYPPKLENGEQRLLNQSTVLFSLVAYKCSESFLFNTTSDKGFIQCLSELIKLHF